MAIAIARDIMRSTCTASASIDALGSDLVLDVLVECCRQPWSDVAGLENRGLMCSLVAKHLPPDHACHMDALQHWWQGPGDEPTWALPWMLQSLHARVPHPNASNNEYFSGLLPFSMCRPWSYYGKLLSLLQSCLDEKLFVCAFFAGYVVQIMQHMHFVVTTEKVPHMEDPTEAEMKCCVSVLAKGLQSSVCRVFMCRELPEDAWTLGSMLCRLSLRFPKTLVDCVEAVGDSRVTRAVLGCACAEGMPKQEKEYVPEHWLREAWGQPTALDAAFILRSMVFSFGRLNLLDTLVDFLPMDCSEAVLSGQVAMLILRCSHYSAFHDMLCEEVDCDKFDKFVRVVDRLSPLAKAFCVATAVKRRLEFSVVPPAGRRFPKYVAATFASAEADGTLHLWVRMFGWTFLPSAVLEAIQFKSTTVHERDILAVGACVRLLVAKFGVIKGGPSADLCWVDPGAALGVLASVCGLLPIGGEKCYHAEARQLVALVLCEWRDVFGSLVNVLNGVHRDTVRAVVKAVVSSSLPFAWALGRDGVLGIRTQMQSLVLLCREADVEVLRTIGAVQALLSGVECFCLHVCHRFRAGSSADQGALLCTCLELLAVLAAGNHPGFTFSSAFSEAVIIVCDASLEMDAESGADADLVEMALWCLQYAHMKTPTVSRIWDCIRRALDKFGMRPKCLGACAACLLVMPNDDLLERCVQLAMAQAQAWMRLQVQDANWLEPVLQLLRLQQCGRGKRGLEFALWVLQVVRVPATRSNLVAVRQIACAATDVLKCQVDDLDGSGQFFPMQALMAVLRFFRKSVDGLDNPQRPGLWIIVWRTYGRKYVVRSIPASSTKFEKVWVETADTVAAYVQPVLTTWMRKVLAYLGSSSFTSLEPDWLEVLVSNLCCYQLSHCTVAPYLLDLTEKVACEVAASDGDLSDLLPVFTIGGPLEMKSFEHRARLQAAEWSVLRRAWCYAVVNASQTPCVH